MSEPAALNARQEPLQRLATLMSAGNPADLASVGNELNRPQKTEQTSDFGVQIELSLILAIAGSDPLAISSLERQMAELKSKIASPAETPLERLAIDHVVLSRLHLLYLESLVLTTPAVDVAKSRLVLQERGRADRQYQAAMKSLAEVQRIQRQVPAKPEKMPKGGTAQRPKIHQPEECAGTSES